MQINIFDIVDGSKDGEYVWICDFRQLNMSKRPIRHIHPQRVLIRSNEEVNKKIYYSKSHFAGLNKKGLFLKSIIIPVFDNTGFRSNTGDPVQVFSTEKECNACYVEMAKDVVEKMKCYKENIEIDILRHKAAIKKYSGEK